MGEGGYALQLLRALLRVWGLMVTVVSGSQYRDKAASEVQEAHSEEWKDGEEAEKNMKITKETREKAGDSGKERYSRFVP